jgi:hypothetical protein
MQYQQPKAPNTLEKLVDPRAAATATAGNSNNMSVSTGLQFHEQ